jgi:predicted Holliday junction resolvase-like endonuclease
MSQYVFLIALLLVLFAVAVLVAYLIARIKELSEQVKEYEKNIAVLNKQVEILEKERAQQLDRIKEDYEKLLEERKREKDELSERLKEYEKINKELFEQLKEYEKNIAVLNEQMEMLEKEYENRLEKWKLENKEKIGKDAIKRSLSTILGKVGEELTPLLMFKKLGIEPKDFRHIGTPIDYVAFKGLSNGKVEEIVFIEVKTANSPSLSDREKEVRKAVDEKRVRFVMINLKEELNRLQIDLWKDI